MPPKKHDLGDEEHPHAEARRLELLLQILEVMLEGGVCSPCVCASANMHLRPAA